MGVIKKAICDRCGKEFSGTAYRVYVYAEDLNGGLTVEAATQNIATNMSDGRVYCPDCVNLLRKEFKF